MSTVTWSLQHKRDTAANFTSNNPTLLAGQLGIETDGLTTTPKFKIGDGVTAWTGLPYFYGGASSAQNLNNVLGVGNSTGGANVVVTDDDIIQVGSTPNRKIGFNTSSIAGGLELVNLNSNDHIILQDAGGIHIDTTYIQVPQLTASQILGLDASSKVVSLSTTTYPSLTELSYVKGVTSAIQTQLNGKQATGSYALTTSGLNQFAATTSLQLAGVISDETGSGSLVFGTSPTFTTSIITPNITGVSSNLVLTNATAASGSPIQFQFTSVANTGQSASTEISNFKVTGNTKTWAAGAITTQRWNYLTANTAAFASASTITNSYGLYVEAATAGTNTTITNNYALGTNGNINITNSTATPFLYITASTNTMFLGGDSSTLYLGTVNNNNFEFYVNNLKVMDYKRSQALFTAQAATGGANPTYRFTVPNHTGLTAGTEVFGFLYTAGSYTWNSGAIITQREFTIGSATYNFAAPSTITNAYSLYVNAPSAGTNATITNNYAAGFSGSVRVIGRVVKNQGADVASANNLVLGSDGNVFEITGTTQVNLISNIAWENGSQVTLLFTSTPTVKHSQATSTTNITIQLAGAADFVASAGDTLTLCLCEIGGTQAWREISRAVI